MQEEDGDQGRIGESLSPDTACSAYSPYTANTPSEGSEIYFQMPESGTLPSDMLRPNTASVSAAPAPALAPASATVSAEIPSIWGGVDSSRRQSADKRASKASRTTSRNSHTSSGARTSLPSRTPSYRRKPVPAYDLQGDGGTRAIKDVPRSTPLAQAKQGHQSHRSYEAQVVLETLAPDPVGGGDADGEAGAERIRISAGLSTTPAPAFGQRRTSFTPGRPRTTSSTARKAARRETDPSIAMDPDVAASAAKLRETRHRSSPATPATPGTPSSPHSPASSYTESEYDRTQSLFFATPLQSPTSSEDVPPLPSRRSKALSTIQRSSSFRKSAETRQTLASLYRITKDAGVELDPARLGFGMGGSRPGSGSSLSGSRTNSFLRPGTQDSQNSGSSLPSTAEESEDLTPLAETSDAGNAACLDVSKSLQDRYKGGMI